MADLPSLDVAALRRRFPALARLHEGEPVVYFDGPAGSQVPQAVIDAVADALAHHNANTHGSFVTSRETGAILDRARRATCELLGTDEADAIIFGPNMTTLAFQLARSLARVWKPGDEVVVTRLDHDANVTPWVTAARDAGAEVRYVPFRPSDTTLDLDALEAALSERTRFVAVGAASNATGTINPIAEISARVRRLSPAQIFVDAVHYAPHALIDVGRWDCDYLACSAYKFFGPHVGILWGRRATMRELPVYQVRPAGDELPGRWSTGTGNHEGIAGTLAAIDYLAGLGAGADGRARLTSAYAAIGAHENALCDRLLDGLRALEPVTVWGIAEPGRAAERAPTVSFTARGLRARDIAQRLGERGIFVWAGNYYALEVTRALGLEPDGMVRIGLLHYNTAAEVDRLLRELRAML